MNIVRPRRLADFAAYIAIAFAFAGTAILFAEYNIDAKWLALAFESAFVFGTVIGFERRRWRLRQFWALLLVLLTAHLLISCIALGHIEKVRAVWVGTAFVIETALIVGILERLTATVAHRKLHRAPDR